MDGINDCFELNAYVPTGYDIECRRQVADPKSSQPFKCSLKLQGTFDLVPFGNTATSVAQKTSFSYEFSN